MIDKNISIITAWGNGYGTGHIQRMISLLSALIELGWKVSIILDRIPIFFPQSLKRSIVHEIDYRSSLIIRDMRDSTIEEIKLLQNISPVLVIDDMGPGRLEADFSCSLLPHYQYPFDIKEMLSRFIFGYNFIQDLRAIKHDIVDKTIDYSIYLGADPSADIINKISVLMSENKISRLLTSHGIFSFDKGKLLPQPTIPFGELLLSTKSLITYFGITLFEGYISKCRLITINPTDYHSTLSDNLQTHLPLDNLGTYESIDTQLARSVLNQSQQNPITIIRPCDILDTATLSLKSFIDYLINILSSI